MAISKLIMCTITKRNHSAMAPMPVPPSSCQDMLSTSQRSLKRRRLDPDCGLSASPVPSSSISSSSPTNTKSKKRSVQFAPTIVVHPIEKWTPQEYQSSCWYSSLDIALFKLQEGTDATLLRHLISTAPSMEQLPQETAFYRGLERLLSPQITREIKQRRRTCVKSVLIEQAIQRQNGVKSHAGEGVERLAEVSKCCSGNATVWARSLGSLV